MKKSLNVGVQVVSVPQLFKTPKRLAETMIDAAELRLTNQSAHKCAQTKKVKL